MAEPLSTSDAPAVCPHCGGRGWVIVADGGVGTARRCSCQEASLGARLYEASGIPPQYRGRVLASFDTQHPDKGARVQLVQALAESRAYVEGFLRADGRFAENGLIFVGPAGVGKTHLAAAVAGELIDRYKVRCRFVEFTALVHQIQATFSVEGGGSKSEILAPIIEAELLVLDELGAQKPTAWVQDLLYLIINSRYTERRPTIFTTNFRLDEPPAGEAGGADAAARDVRRLDYLCYRLPAPLVSRLYEMAKPIALDAVSDYRREVLNVGFRRQR
jgi:DNA replication protein DnaC